MAKLDAAAEKTCLEEISHLVMDAGKKVNNSTNNFLLVPNIF